KTINSPALLTLLPQSLMTQVANLISPNNYISGLLIQGAGIPALTYITAGDGSGNFTLSNPVGTSGTNVIIEVSGLLSYQWRSGTPSAPFWTPFIQDQSEIIEQ